MRAIKKAFIVFVTALCVGTIFSDISTVEAAKKPKARVTEVTAKVSGKKNIKITFKKDKKSTKYGIKKYKIKLTQYNYVEETNKWKKGKVTYKTVSAYKGKKLKNTVSITVKNKKVSNSVAYKVQVASTDSKGSTKTNYTSSKSVGCFHDWLWMSSAYQELVKEAVVEKVKEYRCDGCDMTGNLAEISSHTKTYNGRRADEYITIEEQFLQENNLSFSDLYDENDNFVNNVIGCKFANYIATYLNNKYGYTTKLYTQEEWDALNGATFGCTGATTTGNYLDYEVSPAEYVTKTRMEATCQHCGNTWIKKLSK